MKTFTPQNWPANAPKFDSPEGWEYQKMLARKQAKTEASTLPYMLLQAERAHKAQDYRREMLFLTVALRLAESVDSEYTELIGVMIVTVSAVCDAQHCILKGVERAPYKSKGVKPIFFETWN